MSEFQYSAQLSASLPPVPTSIYSLFIHIPRALEMGLLLMGKAYYRNTIKVNIEMGILFIRLLFFKLASSAFYPVVSLT